MYTIHFNDTLIRFFGGFTISISGNIVIRRPSFASIIGRTGSGKTTVLSAIAHIFGCPAFRAVESVDTSLIEMSHGVEAQHVGNIRQTPAKNFIGNCVAEEIRLSSTISRLSYKEFMAKLENIWLNHFGGDIEIFERHPLKMSSGQQQILAVLVQTLRKPDFLLADEPLSRLSEKNARRVLDILKSLSSTAFVLMSTHEEAFSFANTISLEDGTHHQVAYSGASVSISDQDAPTTKETPKFLRTEIKELLIDWNSFRDEKKISHKFVNMPENTVRNVSGSGETLTTKPLDIDIFMGRRKKPTVSVRGLNLKQGINIIYGENGAGKTLIGRVLGGDIKINPNFSFLKGRYATVSACQLDPYVAGSGIAGGTTLRELHLSYRAKFLSSNPDESLISTDTIEKEVNAIYKNEADAAMRKDILESYGIDTSQQIDSLSFGEKKIVSFILLQSKYSLIVLDELFANLSESLQNDIAIQVLKNCQNGDWSVVALTSNRPTATIDILKRGLAAMKSTSE